MVSLHDYDYLKAGNEVAVDQLGLVLVHLRQTKKASDAHCHWGRWLTGLGPRSRTANVPIHAIILAINNP